MIFKLVRNEFIKVFFGYILLISLRFVAPYPDKGIIERNLDLGAFL